MLHTSLGSVDKPQMHKAASIKSDVCCCTSETIKIKFGSVSINLHPEGQPADQAAQSVHGGGGEGHRRGTAGVDGRLRAQKRNRRPFDI